MKKLNLSVTFSMFIFLQLLTVSAQNPQRLETGKSLEREIRGGEIQSYDLTLDTN